MPGGQTFLELRAPVRLEFVDDDDDDGRQWPLCGCAGLCGLSLDQPAFALARDGVRSLVTKPLQ